MVNGKYLYETHMHTAEASKCSDTPGREYIARYQDSGYDGQEKKSGADSRKPQRIVFLFFILSLHSFYSSLFL